MEIFSPIWNYWLVVAFVAPILWAMVNIIDVYFVGEVYDDAFDGATIMGLFQLLPWIAVFFVKISVPSVNIMMLAMAAGSLYLVAMFYYFKALFAANDATVVGIFWNVAILLLPIIAYLIDGERLSVTQYGGLVIAFIGATLITMDKKIKQQNIWNVFFIMMGSVVFLALSMAISDKVYKETGFLSGFLFFSLGAFIAGILCMCMRLYSARTQKRISLLQLNKKYFGWFFLAELLTLIGILFSQRAIDLSPAVSFVAAIESMQAFFILVLSVVIYVLLKYVTSSKNLITQEIYKNQLNGYQAKIIASIIICYGIYLLST